MPKSIPITTFGGDGLGAIVTPDDDLAELLTATIEDIAFKLFDRDEGPDQGLVGVRR